MIILGRLLLGASLAFLFFSPSVNAASDKDKIYIYAAYSIAQPLKKLLKKYKANVVVVAAGSPLLANQIKHHAHADIFITAHIDWLAGLRATKIEFFVSNKLVLASIKKMQSKNIKDIFETLEIKRQKLALSPVPIPAGTYSKEALEYYGLWDRAQKIAVFSHSSQTTLTWLVQNKIDAGIIYQSDLYQNPKLNLAFAFPPSSHKKIDYYIASLNNRIETKQLREFLLSQRDGLKKFGFQL